MDGTRLGRRIALAILAALLVPAAPAAARHDADPRGAPVVAGPTPSGARLLAFDSHRRLCVAIVEPDDSGVHTSCGEIGPGPRHLGSRVGSSGPGGRGWVGGIAGSEVAVVEFVFADGERIRADTSAGEGYEGRFAGRVRFFIVEMERFQSEPLYVRLVGADGALLSVESESYSGHVVGRRVRVAGGRLRDSRWTLHAFRRRGLASLPDERERLTDSTCVSLGPLDGHAPPAFLDRAEACADPDHPRRDLWLGTDSSCRRLAVTGAVSERVRRVEAVLGDGSRRRARLRPLPASLGPYRGFALVLPPHVAVRRIAAFDARRRVGGFELQLPPGNAGCGEDGSVIAYLFGIGAPEPPAPGPDGPELLARDDGVLLCTAINGFARGGADCQPPPREPEESRIHTQAGARGTFVAGVTPADVAALDLRLDNGRRVRVDTTADGPYAGRYRAHMRFFSLRLGRRRLVHEARFLDTRGRRIATVPGPDPPLFDRDPVDTVRAPGGLAVSAAVGRVLGDPVLCLQLRVGREQHSPQSCGFSEAGFMEVRALCAPRRIVFWGRPPAGVRSVAVRTSRGLLRARIARFPRSLGIGGRVFLLVLPREAAARELITTGRRFGRQTLRLPAAGDQCGYTTFSQLPTR